MENGIAADLHDELSRLYRLAEDLVRFATKRNVVDKAAFVRKSVHPDFDIRTLEIEQEAKRVIEQISLPEYNVDFYFQLQDYINSKVNKVSKATICVLNCMEAQLKAYDEHRKRKVDFKSIDYNFYEGLLTFLTFDYIQRRRKTEIKGLKLNSIGKTVKQFRIFIRDRVRRKIILPIDLADFTIPEEEADAIYR